MINITFPELTDLPREAACLTLRPPSWNDRTRPSLIEQIGIGKAEPRDLGLWTVYEADDRMVELYNASDSFRLDVRRRDELDGAGDNDLDEQVVERLATDWAERFAPRGAAMTLRSITSHEVLVATEPRTDPRRYVTGAQANFSFEVDGVPLLGSGAKLAVTVTPGLEVSGAYRFWRNRTAGPTATLMSADEAFSRFAASRLFANLDGSARATVTAARWGYLCIPPTESQRIARPVMELRGVLETEINPRYEFVVYANLATKISAEGRNKRVIDTLPTLITV